MYSLRFRLIAIFVLIVTATLASFGIYQYIHLSDELEKNFKSHQKEVISRLETSLPSTLWNMDESTAAKIIKAEIQNFDVNEIAVYSAEMPDVSFVRATKSGLNNQANSKNQLPSEYQIKAQLFADVIPRNSAQIPHTSQALGELIVTFSHDYIDKKLRESLMLTILQIFILDAILIIALAMSLKVVFDPIKRLQSALYELSSHDAEAAAELPESKSHEFGKVIRGFNLVLRNLKNIIVLQRQAEALALASSKQTEEAYISLKAAQKSLLQAEKLASLGSLVAGIAHEINTPVGVIVTSASVLADASSEVTQSMSAGAIRKSDITAFLNTTNECSRLIISNASRAAHLIQSFKQVAVDQTSEQRREFELTEFLDDIITSLNPTLRKARVNIQIISQEKIVMDSYPGLLAQVVTNLTMNAVTHAFPDGMAGQIDILVHLTGASVYLGFRDNGRGIPEEFLDKIFEPFFTTKRGQGGTGLGLNIVFNIINKQLCGSITAHNHPEQGAVFTICIPRVTQQLEKI
ncbi:sensor histidine kinase [Undibacterium sp. SXout20W]|uniref:sensor histidine kinase n=1 Tax=Undibacterium sp. SXout20W TaxID=3413051 RepID=UPI003BF36C78